MEADRPTTNGREDKTDRTNCGLTQMYADISVGELGRHSRQNADRQSLKVACTAAADRAHDGGAVARDCTPTPALRSASPPVLPLQLRRFCYAHCS